MIGCELKKAMMNKKMWLVVCIPAVISILLWVDFQMRYESYLMMRMAEMGLTPWQMLFKEQRILFFKEFLPVFSVLVMMEVLSTEQRNGGWRLLLTMPQKKSEVYFSKLVIACLYVTVMLLVNAVGLLAVGTSYGFEFREGLGMVTNMFVLQWLGNMAVVGLMYVVYWILKKQVNVIWITLILCFLSQELYYRAPEFSRYNLFNFSSLADGLVPFSSGYITVVSVGVFVIAALFGIRWFERKDF